MSSITIDDCMKLGELRDLIDRLGGGEPVKLKVDVCADGTINARCYGKGIAGKGSRRSLGAAINDAVSEWCSLTGDALSGAPQPIVEEPTARLLRSRS